MTRVVEILLFDDVEVLDFAGPLEVLSVAGRRSGLEPFSVHTVSEDGAPIRCRNDLVVHPTHGFASAPAMVDYLVVPGGFGTRGLMASDAHLDWVRKRAATAERTLSVCTGALVLGAAGLLDGIEATTHFQAMDELRRAAPGARVVEGCRWVDAGPIVTAAGVAAGIDASLHLIASELGEELARETARYIEYPWPSPSARAGSS